MTSNCSRTERVQAMERAMVTRGIPGFSALVPCILGLALARSSEIAACYDSYRQTDFGIFTDGSVLISLLILGTLAAWLAVRHTHLSQHATRVVLAIGALFQAATLLAMFGMALDGRIDRHVQLLLCLLHQLGCAGAFFFWLRQAINSNTAVAALLAFAAMALSEPIIYLYSMLPDAASFLGAGIGALLQIPCLLLLRRKRATNALARLQSLRGFSLEKIFITNRGLLITLFMAIAYIALALGLLRGYPDGQAIPFTDTTRIGYMLLTILAELIIVFTAMRGKLWMLTVAIWVVLQSFVAAALMGSVLFPANLEIGAVFTTSANALVTAFTFFLDIVLMTCLSRYDPWFYANALRSTWLGARGLTRIFAFEFLPAAGNTLLIVTCVALLLVVSTQVLFIRLFVSFGLKGRGSLSQRMADFAERCDAFEAADRMVKALPENTGSGGGGPGGGGGVCGGGGNGSGAQGNGSGAQGSDTQGTGGKHACGNVGETPMSLRVFRGTRELGRTFLLSEREIEVLTLFAQGYTQKRIAQKLYISPGTAHTHIKRIYAKTGLHSRQDILDYLAEYTT
ncbi:MAG: helix-turn-helix transcriptional regulator [Coriobacteriales bacterium]|jgi:DNA-binding CsgD family transcriptional regulator|nr:helix-turn-helix transcriptional regulator [Coriobacteriales bacterium]